MITNVHEVIRQKTRIKKHHHTKILLVFHRFLNFEKKSTFHISETEKIIRNIFPIIQETKNKKTIRKVCPQKTH